MAKQKQEEKPPQRCATCRFFKDKYPTNTTGICCRFPPSRPNYPSWLFSISNEHDWCGEWKEINHGQ